MESERHKNGWTWRGSCNVRCGICIAQGIDYDVKSFLEMQLHKSKKHGEKNQMSPYDNKKAFQAQQGGRKEREGMLMNTQAIDRWKNVSIR
jgi:hypothetical protein